MSHKEYIFNLDYDVLDSINIPFSAVNIAGVDTNSTYSGAIGALTFNIDFNNADTVVSDIDYFIDFGDGTISRDFSATHIYDIPGDYKVTLVVSDSANNLFKSDDSRFISVRNVIPDVLQLTFSGDGTQFRSAPTAPMIVTRYNSVETSKILSANDYSINLSVSGNESDLFTEDTYYKTGNIQLKRGSFFMDKIGTDFNVIDSIKTSSNNIYAKLDGGSLVFNGNKEADNYFVGTSGFATFFYYED